MSAPTIAVFTKNRTNPAYSAARLGAERTADRLGARVVHYVPQQPDSVEEQIVLVDRALAERPDAFVFVPVHDTAMDESVRRINAAGIPLFNIINRLARGEYVTFVGSDDYRLGREVARRLLHHIGGNGDVAVISGVPAAVTGQDRLRGFHDAVREFPGVRIAAERAGDFQRDGGRRAMEDLLRALPRIDGVLSANDAMSLGAIEAIEAAKRRIPVIGVNAVPEAVTALKSGRLLATVDFDALKISCVATEAAIRHLRGEAVPHEIVLPVQIVDFANCQPWDRPLEERECPKWDDVVRQYRVSRA
ncbi:MAG TPA: sugar ABC transporter substrate-binding protein [Burkholderiales bacterium]|nr:sugar ABC transporter substrate-binding protein [Burkholderiales bacterium]